jgi:hypothetical protein
MKQWELCVQGKRLEFIICLDSTARMRILCAWETLDIYNIISLDSATRMRLLCAREALEIYNYLGFLSEDANFVCKGNA